MSVELDDRKLPKPQKRQKRDLEKPEKERRHKRKATEEVETTSPKKKHKSKPPKAISAAQALAPTAGPTPSPQTSPFYEQTSSLYLPIAPIAQAHPIRALCAEHISPLLLSYYSPFHGVLISYSNPRLSSNPLDVSAIDGRQKAFARSVDEYAASFIWLTAEFLVFRPQKGDVIEGFVNLQSENTIGILYWNFFNASIERRFLPRDWRWRSGGMSARRRGAVRKLKKDAMGSTESEAEDEEVKEYGNGQMPEVGEDDVGHFQDGDGKKIEGLLRFYVKHVETSKSADPEHRFLGIEGTMLSPGEEHTGSDMRPMTNGSIFGGDLR